jgi:nucleoside-diphosphate-sugar epimerase
VTGDRGFIGRHFARHLREEGWEVYGADIADQSDARDVFRARGGPHYDLVIHAAAVVGGRSRIEWSPLSQAVNLELDAALFGWARHARPGRVIYFSSSAAYPVAMQGVSRHRRLKERHIDLDMPAQPDSLYGWMKLTGERLAALARSEGVKVSVVRPFSGYGEDQDADYPFRAFADRARKREDPFAIWGNGQQVRDFVHADDIVAVVMAMAEDGIDGPVNVGHGEPVSMIELAGMFAREAGYEPEFRVQRDAPSGVAYRVCDPARMLGIHVPQISLREGVRRALEHDP